MVYFKKEQVGHPLYLPRGGKVQFEDVDGDTGLLATDDGTVISELRKSIGRLGIVEITVETYDSLKKKAASMPSANSLRRPTDRSLQALLVKNGAGSGPGSRGNVAVRGNPAGQPRSSNPTAPLTTTPEIVKPPKPVVGRTSDFMGGKGQP